VAGISANDVWELQQVFMGAQALADVPRRTEFRLASRDAEEEEEEEEEEEGAINKT
jgi:hypothetical protein